METGGPLPEPPVPYRGLADLCHVAGLRALRTVNDLELERLPLIERPAPAALDRREVDEHVGAAVTSDETVTLGVVDPPDLPCDTHRAIPALQWRGAWRRMRPAQPRPPAWQRGLDIKKDRESAA